MQIHEVVMRMLNLQFKCDHIVKKKKSISSTSWHKLSVLPIGIKVWVEWG